MNTDPKARDLFIVDNSISGWTGLRYLEEWAGIARGFDVATGYFEIGSLLALDGKWQGLDKIRILMGGEITYRTRKAILDAVKARALAHLDARSAFPNIKAALRAEIEPDEFKLKLTSEPFVPSKYKRIGVKSSTSTEMSRPWCATSEAP